MSKLPHPRLVRLLNAVSTSPLTQDELAQRLNVSTRTIRTDVALLNHVMVNHGAHLIHQRSVGYLLKIYNQPTFQQFLATVQQTETVPRTSQERIIQIQMLLLTAEQGLKLDVLAETWNLSRTVIQSDMTYVRTQLASFGLIVVSKPRLGLLIQGPEIAIRACLSQLIYVEQKETKQALGLISSLFPVKSQQIFAARFRDILSANKLYISDDGLHWLTLYAAVTLQRLACGRGLTEFSKEDVIPSMMPIAESLFLSLPMLLPATIHEVAALAIHLQARITTSQHLLSLRVQRESEKLVTHILDYIYQNYPYDVRNDEALNKALHQHIAHMIIRVKHHVATVNPLAEHIKQHYPLAYNITLAAISDWIRETGYCMTQHEIGYLVIHIGVGLERNYQLGHRAPKALLYCDAGNAVTLGLEAIIHRHYPHLNMKTVHSPDILSLTEVSQADIIITTTPLSETPIPSFLLDPFPTQHQLEELGKRVLVDRTRSYLLNKYFAEERFLYLDDHVEQSELFKQVCEQLESEELVERGYGASLQERESIVSTMMGEYIALPHSIELFAKRSLVYTVVSPKGIDWGNSEKAHLIFFMALSKYDYEEAMGLYDLFLTLVNKKVSKTLSQCETFAIFKEMTHLQLQ